MMGASEVVMIIVALIGVFGSVITNIIMNGKSQAVIETKLENLISEVKQHSEFAVKIPGLELEVSYLKKEIAEIKASISK